MKRLLLPLGLFALLLVGGVLACSAWLQPPGARLKMPPTSLRPLPSGNQWVYEFHYSLDQHLTRRFGLEIRRSSEKLDAGSSVVAGLREPWVTKDAAEAVLASSLVTAGPDNVSGTFAVSLIDLRYFSSQEEMEHPFRVGGGLEIDHEMGRTAAPLPGSETFVVGRLVGHTTASSTDWRSDELCALLFQTTDEARMYRYYVVLVALPGKT